MHLQATQHDNMSDKLISRAKLDIVVEQGDSFSFVFLPVVCYLETSDASVQLARYPNVIPTLLGNADSDRQRQLGCGRNKYQLQLLCMYEWHHLSVLLLLFDEFIKINCWWPSINKILDVLWGAMEGKRIGKRGGDLSNRQSHGSLDS